MKIDQDGCTFFHTNEYYLKQHCGTGARRLFRRSSATATESAVILYRRLRHEPEVTGGLGWVSQGNGARHSGNGVPLLLCTSPLSEASRVAKTVYGAVLVPCSAKTKLARNRHVGAYSQEASGNRIGATTWT